jgi:Rrf2 family protein
MIMRLSEGIESGLHCALGLAMIPEGTVLPAKALAEFHGVSVSYLLKHLQALTAAGILLAAPGPRGGYRLARAPDQITVLDVVLAIEGEGPAFRCTEIRQRGPCAGPASAYKTPCAINRTMLRAEEAWRDALRSETIAGLVKEVSGKMDARSARRAAEWVELRLRYQKEDSQ